MSFWNKLEKSASDAPIAPAEPTAPRRTEPTVVGPSAAPPVPPPPAPTPPASARADAAPPAAAPARTNDLRLGRGVRLEGKLTFSGTVRVDATFKGSIVTDGVLVVGDQAKVDADITCGTVVIEGEVNGNVTAREVVELRRTAKLRGDIQAPALAIERGAVFDGTSKRPGSASASGGKSAAAAPA